MSIKFGRLITIGLVALILTSVAFAEAPKRAIVLASFGTTHPEALKALINIGEMVQQNHPDYLVKHAFTSNIIRKIWQDRQNDAAYLKENKGACEAFLYVKNPLATVADLQNQGCRTIIVQSTHVFAGEMYSDLCSYISGLNSIKTLRKKYMPFDRLVVGRPALGEPGTLHPYHKDVQIAAKALKADALKAKNKGSALVYMGHGNEVFSTGAYIELEHAMRKMYPDTPVFIGVVEGFPAIDDVLSALKQQGIKNVFMKPLMVVAGDHAKNDMAGEEADSWKNVFEKNGIRVVCEVKGLGENDLWAQIYSDHVRDVIQDFGME